MLLPKTHERRLAQERVRTCARRLRNAAEVLFELGETEAHGRLLHAMACVEDCERVLVERIAATRSPRGAKSRVEA